TKQEQSDLFAILFGSHGDTTRIALAPSTVEEAFYDTVTAFNLADKYQCPVFLVSDLSLALNKQTVEQLDLSRVTIDRGLLLTDEEIAAQAEEDGFRQIGRASCRERVNMSVLADTVLKHVKNKMSRKRRNS